MATSFTCSHRTSSSPEEAFDRARDVDLHLETMAASGERAVGGVTTGLLGLDDEVTWSARHAGIPWRMTVRITEFDRPHRFVDEQVAGPFRTFRHEHSFGAWEGGVVVRDRVEFAAPFGPLGRALEPLLRWYLRRLVCRRTLALTTG